MTTGMTPEDLSRLVQAEDVQVAPQGDLVAFTVTSIDTEANDYRTRVWLAPVDRSEPPRPFTAGERRDTLPRWSPDGRRLAFVSHREQADGAEIYTLAVHGGGEAVKVCALPADVTEMAWSPDGGRLAFVSRDPEPERYGKHGQPRRSKTCRPGG